MLDKDNSKTLEKEEVCEFVKKLINIIVRNVKNSVHVSSHRSCTHFRLLERHMPFVLLFASCPMLTHRRWCLLNRSWSRPPWWCLAAKLLPQLSNSLIKTGTANYRRRSAA